MFQNECLQQSDSVTHSFPLCMISVCLSIVPCAYTGTLLFTPSAPTSLHLLTQDIEYCPLCYTAGPCLSVPYIPVCIC